MNTPNLLTVREFAKECKVSEHTVRRWIKEHRILAIKQKQGFRYSYLIEKSEVQKIAENSK